MTEYLGLPQNSQIERSKKKQLFFDENNNLLKIPNSRGKVRQPNTKEIRKFLKGSEEGYVDLILVIIFYYSQKCFEWDQEKRISPDQALNHPWIIAGIPKELLNARKKENEIKAFKAHKESTSKEKTVTKDTPKGIPSKPSDVNQTQKSNYLSFKTNQMKNNSKTYKLSNLTVENKMNSKFVNNYNL